MAGLYSRIKAKAQKKIDAYLLRKAKEAAREKVKDFIRPPDVSVGEKPKDDVAVEKHDPIDYPLVGIVEHFSINFIFGFVELLSDMLQEKKKLKKESESDERMEPNS